MRVYRFVLEKYSGKKSRYACPGCGAKDEFTRYIDTDTNKHVAENVGICNRADKCGYHYPPQSYFKDKGIKPTYDSKTIKKVIQPKTISYIDNDIFAKTLRDYQNNNFIQYLIRKFGAEKTYEQIKRYNIGTSKYWHGAVVFWQQDMQGKIRTGKVMLYNPDTGKRIKEPYNCITWAHKALGMPNFNTKQCFFGEHLLNGSKKPIGVVESEKTAIIASIHFPSLVWLATGSLNGLTLDKCEVLEGRKVVLYPDLNVYDIWNNLAKKIPYISGFSISNLLEMKANSEAKSEGWDLADFLLMNKCQ